MYHAVTIEILTNRENYVQILFILPVPFVSSGAERYSSSIAHVETYLMTTCFCGADNFYLLALHVSIVTGDNKVALKVTPFAISLFQL